LPQRLAAPISSGPMANERKLPAGRLGRLTRLAGLGARTGVSMLRKKGPEAAAEHAAEVLGSLRGLAAKIGQMASYVDGVVPESHRDAYETTLRTLRAAAPTSPPAAIRAVVEEDLGDRVDVLFAEWDDEPFASASIGQVHRARLVDGRVLAVKVQHPGIRRAVESDLANAGILESMIGPLGGRKLNSDGVLAELRARFLEELDYELEARRQLHFAELHAGDPEIRIPDVVLERSGKRVLATELASGRSLDDVMTAPEDERRRFGETLWRFVFKGNLVGGMFNADPHPGNYLFQDAGKIAFVDFGCVQPIEGRRHRLAQNLHRAGLALDEAAFAEAAKQLLATRGGRYEEMAVAYSRMCFEPIFGSPFRITRTYTTELMAKMQDFGRASRSLLEDGFVPLPEGMLFMNRLQFGFYSVLARLDVEVDYASVERRFLAEAGLL
jgi:predicted unusual protein kinase regulating ubiquinone biosynthesis (AarF/ABC1/UbiB family)